MSNPQVPLSGSVGSAGPFPTLGSTPVVLPDADHVLIDPSETCYQQIIVTGALTADRNLVCPLVAGFTYLVVNNTTGGHNVLVGGVSGVKVAVPPSVSSSGTWVTTDGTNYGQGGSSGGSSGPGSAGYVIFRPGVASAGQAVATEAEIDAAILNGAIGLVIDSATAPANFAASHVFTKLQWIAAFNNQFAQAVGADLLTILDGAVVTDFPQDNRNGLAVKLACATTVPIVYSNNAPELFGSFAAMQVNAGATVPACQIPNGQQLIVWADRGFEVGSLQGGVPFFEALNGGFLEFLAFAACGINATTVKIDAGATVVFRGDASNPIPAFTNAGTLLNLPFDSDQAMTYGSGTVFPATPPLIVGRRFYRTDIGATFSWSGSAWVLVPKLSRTLFVDGGGNAAVANGSQPSPYVTISAALATLGHPVSVADANAVSQAWIAPTIGGYTAEPGGVIAIPAYRQVWIQAIPNDASIASTVGPSTPASITWANTAANGGAFPPSTLSQLAIVGLQVADITITDDGTSAEILIIDETNVNGGITATGATVIDNIIIQNESTVTGAVNAPTTTLLVGRDSFVEGAITVGVLSCDEGTLGPGAIAVSGGTELTSCSINGSTYNVDTLVAAECNINGTGVVLATVEAINTLFFNGSLGVGTNALIENCTFSGGFQLSVTGTLTIDAGSWVNYLAQGGLTGGITTLVIIGQAAKGYVANFPQNLTLTPGAGTPMAAFNLTPEQTGELELTLAANIVASIADQPSFVVLLYVGSSTGGTPSTRNSLVGSGGTPIVPPGGAPTAIMNFSTPVTSANISAAITATITGLALGTAVSIVVEGASGVAAVWNPLNMNGQCVERTVN